MNTSAEDGISDLYRTQQRQMLALATLITGDRELAADSVQDCFAELTRRGLGGIESPEGYLRTMVANRCYRLSKANNRTYAIQLGGVGAYDDYHLVELLDSLARLPAKRRTAVVLRYVCDMPVGDIAEAMGVKPSTVSSLLTRSKKSLERLIHD